MPDREIVTVRTRHSELRRKCNSPSKFSNGTQLPPIYWERLLRGPSDRKQQIVHKIWKNIIVTCSMESAGHSRLAGQKSIQRVHIDSFH